MSRVLRVVIAFAVVVTGATHAATSASAEGQAPVWGESLSSYLTPFAPVRIADTRASFGLDPAAVVGGVETFTDPLTSEVLAAAGVVRADVVAVVANITVTQTTTAGYVTVWPTGGPRPVVSNLNAITAGTTIANLATVQVGADGHLGVFNSTGGHLIIDVQGVYTVAVTAPTAGRFVPLTQSRVLDTRESGSAWQDRESRAVSFIAAGVPADASAIVFNLTATNTTGPGFFTVYPSGGTVPLASNLNVDYAGQTRANQVIAAATAGAIDVFALRSADLVVDVAGYYTGTAAPASMQGVFRAIPPIRLMDSRAGYPDGIPGGSEVFANLIISGAVPPGVVAAVMNVTIVAPVDASYLTVFPAGASRPATSTVNAAAQDVVANHAIVVPTGQYSQVSVFGRATGHALVDVFGYFAVAHTAPPGIAPEHAFLSEIEPGSPRTWDRCSPIPYYVDPNGGTAQERALIAIAAARIEAASGFHLEPAGDVHNPDAFPSQDYPGIAIGFVPPDDPILATYGLSGLAMMDTDPEGNYVSGRVRVRTGESARSTVLTMLLHELGHILGLAHVDSGHEIMGPGAYPPRGSEVDYQPGDVEGFAALHAAAPCN